MRKLIGVMTHYSPRWRSPARRALLPGPLNIFDVGLLTPSR